MRIESVAHISYFKVKQFFLQYRYAIAVSGCMIIHAILCLYQIGRADFWVDELLALDSVRYNFGYILRYSFEEHNQPPLYFALLWIWHRLFGDGEAVLRLLSTIFSVCIVPVVAKIGLVAFSKRVGVIAALLTACSFFLVIYAQEVRAYSMLCFASALSILYFIYFMQEYMQTKQVSGSRLFAYVLVSVANLYIHPYAIFVLVAQAFIALLLIVICALPAKYMIRAGAVICGAVIPVLLGYTFDANATGPLLNNAWWISTPNIDEFIRTVMYAHIPKHSKRAVVYLYLAISLFVFIGVKAGIALHKHRVAFWKIYWADALLVATLGMVVVVPFFASLVLSPFFVIRYTIAASVVLYLLLARGIALLPWKTVQLSLVIVLCATLIWTTDTLWRGQGKKPQFRLAIQHIAEHKGPGDIIITDVDRIRVPRTFTPIEYYIEKYDMLNSGQNDMPILNTRVYSIDFIARQLLDADGWYAVSNHGSLSIDQVPNLSAILQQVDCTIEQPEFYRVLVVSLSNCSGR